MNLRSLLVLSAAAVGLSVTAHAAVETYEIDPVHSSVAFNIRHFFTPVAGSFTKFSGTIKADRDNPQNNSVEASIQIASIDTRNTKRDDDLRSARFFDAEKFPTMSFKSTAWKKTGDDTFDVAGDLTIHGVTKPVVLRVKSLGFGPGMQGREISGWQATTTLNRNDFGITTYPKMLGADVPVTIDIEADKTR